MGYIRTHNTPSAAETDQWATAHLANRGLRRGKRYRAGVGCIFDPQEDAARRSLVDVAARLEAVATAPVVPPSRSIMPKMNTPRKNTDTALRDALRATDRLLGRRRR